VWAPNFTVVPKSPHSLKVKSLQWAATITATFFEVSDVKCKGKFVPVLFLTEQHAMKA
jgi:hypothetical protein